MTIRESAEDYLEAILVLKKRKGSVRSIDIARYLDFSKPSVSRAVGLLKKNGYIEIDKDGWIALTVSGNEIAQRIYERHEMVLNWLIRLGVSEETAAKDACRLEHYMSEETFEKLKTHILANE